MSRSKKVKNLWRSTFSHAEDARKSRARISRLRFELEQGEEREEVLKLAVKRYRVIRAGNNPSISLRKHAATHALGQRWLEAKAG